MKDGFGRKSVCFTLENVRVDRNHPHCVVCGRRLDHAGRSSVRNLCRRCAGGLDCG
jgi:predicted amidophosphoribosyltransferase